MRGRFITFEGGEGAGKSTQVQRLRRRLEAAGLPVVATREPGGSPKAERIREALLSGAGKPLGAVAETLLFSAARLDHLQATIEPALAQGKFVLCDRFFDSTRAYQGLDPAVNTRLLDALERVVVGETRPDLTLVLDLPAPLGLARAAARRDRAESADRFEAERGDYHHRLREAFLLIAAAEPRRCVVIAADREADVVEEAVWRAVETRLLAGAPAPEVRASHDG